MLPLVACYCNNVRGCRTIALGHDIYRVIQESAVLYGCFNKEILVNMGPFQTFEGVLAGT